MKNTISINGVLFPSKKALKAYVQDLLKAKKGSLVLGQDGFAFLCALMQRHPEWEAKRGAGIKRLIIRKAWGPGLALFIERTDGTEIDVSWNIAIKGHAATERRNLLDAMRVAVHAQVLAFKKPNVTCRFCTAPGTEVDHVNAFSYLAKCFLLDKTPPTDFDDHPTYFKACFKLKDRAFEDDWVGYHKAFANFQMLCPACNVKKGAK